MTPAVALLVTVLVTAVFGVWIVLDARRWGLRLTLRLWGWPAAVVLFIIEESWFAVSLSFVAAGVLVALGPRRSGDST